MDCLFCKMVNGDIKPDIVFEDENVLAFKDISPQAPVHILIIPKKHYSNIMETPATEMEHIFSAIQKLAEDQGLQDGFRVVNNCGNLGGQTVSHLHFHLLGKRQLSWPPG